MLLVNSLRERQRQEFKFSLSLRHTLPVVSNGLFVKPEPTPFPPMLAVIDEPMQLGQEQLTHSVSPRLSIKVFL